MRRQGQGRSRAASSRNRIAEAATNPEAAGTDHCDRRPRRRLRHPAAAAGLPPATPPVKQDATDSLPAASSTLVRNLLLAFAVALVALSAATFLLLRAARKRHMLPSALPMK